jgi:hypothetical protein
MKREDCRCFLFDHAEGSETTCECGHELDEHDEHGECWALITAQDLHNDHPEDGGGHE